MTSRNITNIFEIHKLILLVDKKCIKNIKIHIFESFCHVANNIAHQFAEASDIIVNLFP